MLHNYLTSELAHFSEGYCCFRVTIFLLDSVTLDIFESTIHFFLHFFWLRPTSCEYKNQKLNGGKRTFVV